MHKILRALIAVCALLAAVPCLAQYAESPDALFATDGGISSAAQIGRRLFIAGPFRRVSPPTGSAVVVDTTGGLVAGAFPKVAGSVHQIIPDGAGGWLLVGDFTSIGGQPTGRFARVGADRRVDTRYRVEANGIIRLVAVAHGRIYLAGDFTAVNSAPRRGLAALNAVTGELSGWGSAFAGGPVLALSISSLGVYVSAAGRLSGFDAGTGAVLFARAATVTAIAATSTRIYVGGYGYQRPVWAVDPFTGQDDGWALGFQFRPIRGTYSEYTAISSLLLDAGRLYLAGNFHTIDDVHHHLAAVDAASGAPSPWNPPTQQGTGFTPPGLLVRIASVIVFGTSAFDVVSGADQGFRPQTFGAVRTVAAAPEGAVIGGDFDGIGGVNREGLASIDLDTAQIEPWTSALPPFTGVEELVSDGTWLIGRTRDSRFFKIDPVSGAIVAEQRVSTGDVILVRMRLAGSELVTAVSERYQSPKVGVITIADWSYRQLPVTFDGPSQYVTGVDVDGDSIYFMGAFAGVNGQSRPFLAAVRKSTGEVLPWRPSPDDDARAIRVVGGRAWLGGDFHRIGGQRRRGLAELDPVTGAARTWNPDVPVGILQSNRLDVSNLDVGPDGLLYVTMPGLQGGVVSGQQTTPTVAFSPVTGRRLPWRPTAVGWAALLPDCMVVATGCLRAGVTPPTDLEVSLAGASATLRWTVPTSLPARTGVRLEVGSAEGRADLYQADLPATQTVFTASAPRGNYFARVRSLAAGRASMATPDVSFAVGPPDVPAAPLDVTAVTEGTQLTIEWQSPSIGAPAAYVFDAGSARGRSDVASLILPGTATRFTVDAPVGFYWGRLRAVNGNGTSTPSGEVSIDVGATRQTYCGDGPPQAPLDLASTLSARTVTVTWRPSPDGSTVDLQRLYAGSAPGLTDLAGIDLASSATSFTATAPPGTYYLRVVAFNACGGSPPSHEVQVVVP